MPQDERNRDLNDGEREIDLIELLAYLVRYSRLLIFALVAGLVIGAGISAGSYFYRQLFAGDSENDMVDRAKNSLASEHVLNEIDLAFQETKRGVRFFPLKLDHEEMGPAFKYYLSRQHWMDATLPPLEKRLDEFVEKLMNELDLQ